jgi:hypothetical protein
VVVAVPFPSETTVNLERPDPDEVQLIGRGLTSAAAPPTGLTELQRTLFEAVATEMTGYGFDPEPEPIDPRAFAEGLAARNEGFRGRIVQIMILGALVLRPLPRPVVDQVQAFAAALGVHEGLLDVCQEFAAGTLGLAALDFDRNGYAADWSEERQAALHTDTPLADAWEQSVHDPELAARWCALERLPEGTLGRRLAEFYRARGFVYPGLPGSAPPLLAQHDWVHVLADYGTWVESELVVFAFVARANDDPRGFALLAMVVSLFETGYLRAGAGLFEASPGQLSRTGVAERVADAMRRGALVDGSVDFLAVDWFELAPLPLDEARARFGIVEKSDAAKDAGSVTPWETGGISEYQWKTGEALAERDGRAYDPYGAAVGATPPA